MLITASWEGGDVSVEVDEACRSLAALRHTLAAAVPELDAEKVCLEIGGCAADDEAVCSLCEGSVVAVSVTPAVRAAATLREEGRTADLGGFCAAAEEGDMRACELYLEAEVHREVPAPFSETPLHIACRKCNIPLCTLLLDAGCRVIVQDGEDGTILHEAVYACCVDWCRLLIKAGCPIDVRDGGGDTALRRAIRMDSVELCKLLIDNGAMANLTMPERQSLLDAALHAANYPDIHTLLTEHAGPIAPSEGS